MHHAMKIYGGVEIQVHASIILSLNGGQWTALFPGHFAPWGRALGAHWIGGWIGFKSYLDAVEKRKVSCPCWESNIYSSVVQPIA
jgi:hypothetical protein